MSQQAMVSMYQRIDEASHIYECDAREKNVHEKRKVEGVESDSFRRICGVRRQDKTLNIKIRRMCNKDVGVGEIMDGGMLTWFGNIEKMWNECNGWYSR